MKFVKFVIATFFTMALAMATSVTFSTGSTELCIGGYGCGTNSIVAGDVTVKYIPSAMQTVDTPTFANFGALLVYCTNGGTACGASALPANLILHLAIDQTVPSAGIGLLQGGVLEGMLSGTSSTAVITWSGTLLELGGVEYSVANSPLGLVPPSNDNCGPNCPVTGPAGKTTIQGFVNAPEPGAWVMLSTGLVLVLMRRDRKT